MDFSIIIDPWFFLRFDSILSNRVYKKCYNFLLLDLLFFFWKAPHDLHNILLLVSKLLLDTTKEEENL